MTSTIPHTTHHDDNYGRGEMKTVLGFQTFLIPHGDWPSAREWYAGSDIWHDQWLPTDEGAMSFKFLSVVGETKEDISGQFHKLLTDLGAQMAVAYNLPVPVMKERSQGVTLFWYWEFGIMRFKGEIPACPRVSPPRTLPGKRPQGHLSQQPTPFFQRMKGLFLWWYRQP